MSSLYDQTSHELSNMPNLYATIHCRNTKTSTSGYKKLRSRKFVQLGDLERHVADCGFAPAVCSNEGCQLEVNKQDLLHHETVVCELRRVKCHSCNDIKQEMDTVKVNLAAMNEKFDRNRKANEKQFETLNSKVET